MSYFIDLSLLRTNRNYRLLYIGQFVSLLGTMITSVALPYQIYEETKSTLMVGLLSLCQLIPLLVTALLGGALADRHHRRTLLLISEFCLAIGCLLLALNSYAFSKICILFVVATLMSAINGLHRPALDSITQQLVAKKDFIKVGALLMLKGSISMIAGPALGGILISGIGLTFTYLVDFGSFAISLIALYLISDIPKPLAKTDMSTIASMKQGFAYAFSRQELVGTYVVDFVAMITSMPTALFPAIADAHGGVKTLGLLYSAPAVGALLLSFVSGWVHQIKRHGLAVAVAAALWGLAIIGFGLASHLYLALFFLCLAGAFDAASGIFRGTIWNQTIPNELRGRLSGIEMISYLSGPKLGDTRAGLVASISSVTFSVVSGGFLCIIGVAIVCYCLPKFRNYYAKVVTE